jgi:adenylylsulfate kinase
MEEKKGNIFTSHAEVLQKSDKESLLQQRAVTFWLTGLSGSGKSTIAQLVERSLHAQGFLVMLLDGDNVRDGLNKNLGFTEEGRIENIRRIAEVNKLFNNCGVITINAFVSPTREIRNMAKSIIGDKNFHEIYVNTPLEICESRDVKGLYKKARAGEIPNFTGIDAPFEAPANADFTLYTETDNQDQSAQKLVEYIIPKIQLN